MFVFAPATGANGLSEAPDPPANPFEPRAPPREAKPDVAANGEALDVEPNESLAVDDPVLKPEAGAEPLIVALPASGAACFTDANGDLFVLAKEANPEDLKALDDV